jgi:enediyne biosynthesis protein E7
MIRQQPRPISATVPVRSPPPLASEPLDISFESDSLTVLERNFALHGDAFRIFSPALERHIWVLSNPDHVRHILVDRSANFTKGIGIDRVAILLGNGLMTSDGETWRTQRRMVQPSFHRNIIATWMPHLHAANAALARKWTSAAAAGAAVNVTQDMSEVTLEVVLRALFGDDLVRLTSGRDGNPFALLTDDTERNLAFAYKFRQLGALILDEVQRRRRDGVRHNDIVSQLIDARDRQTDAPMGDRQLIDEIMTLIVAGHETTASSLNWFWYLLTTAPDVAARLHAEVDAGAIDPPGYRDLDSLPFTRRAIDETLRLYPPGWLLTRRTIAADTVGGISLPEKADVLVSPYLVQRHPAYWPDPARFAPDRFLPETNEDRNRFAYLPFGLGPRACIGEHLALVEMHTHVATLARRFHLELVPGQTIELEPQVNLRTRHPLRMIPRLRN